MEKRIHIGTSGWSYKHWRNIYYPAKLASSKWLPFYAQSFSSTEINGSFYRLPSQETVIKWMEQVPKNFVFCPKMSRYLSHMKKLNDPEEPMERFFEVFKPMKKQMGPVLIQLPRMVKFKFDRDEYFFRLLAKAYRKYEFVLEVRHESWLTNDALNLLAKYNTG